MSDEIINKLKTVSTSALEAAIEKVVSELVGVQYECHISKIDYDPFFDANLEISLHKPSDWNITPKQGPGSST